MDNKYKILLKNMGFLTISNFSSKILVFLLVPLYTSVLSTSEYGIFDALVTTVQFIAPIVICNITDGVMRFLLEKKYDPKLIIKVGYKYVFAGSTIVAILSYSNSKLHIVSFLNGYELLFFLYYLTYTLNSLYVSVAKGLNRVVDMAIGGVIGTVSMILAYILFLLVFEMGLEGFFCANILGQAVPVIYYLFRLRVHKREYSSSCVKNIETPMLMYSWPLVFNTVGWTINSSLDKYCVIWLCGISASGLLGVSYKIPTILSVVYAIFTQAWQISAVEAYDKEDRNSFYSNMFLYVNTFGTICCAGLILFNRCISSILFSKDFYQAYRFVPFLLLSIMFNQTAGFIGPLLSAKKDSNAMAKAAVVGSIANLVLNISLIKLLGVQGAAIATAISSFIIYFVRWFFARDLLNTNIYQTLYSSWFCLTVDALVESYYDTYIIQLICLVVIIYINRKQLLQFANAIRRKNVNKNNMV